MAGMMIFTLTACANSTEPDNAVQNTEQSSIAPEEENQTESLEVPEGSEMAEPKGQSSCLIVYFSQTGNTETIAGMIAEHTGGELFHVETVTVYPDEYNDLIEVAKEEQDN